MAFQLRGRIQRILARQLPPAPARPIEPSRTPVASTVHQGFIDERSRFHIAGWARNLGDAGERPEVAVWVRRGGRERLLARLRAEEFSEPLFTLKVGDGHHGFFVVFETPLAEGEEEDLVVRVAGSEYELPRAPQERRGFTPIAHIAVDIVNNCNIRCPFCVYDYARTRSTKLMSEDTFRNILPLVPHIAGVNFWLSCLHEPTLHPGFTRFIGVVPEELRRKIFFTTNLAKRQPDSYFEFLSTSGIHHVSISVESFEKAIYEKMRKGARYEVFLENLDKLTHAFARAANPPLLRFVTLAFRSNLNELPALVERTRRRYGAWQNEIRHAYDMAYIAQSFRDEEYIGDTEWSQIRHAFAGASPEHLILIEPPKVGAEASPVNAVVQPRVVPRPLNLRIEWDGHLYVYGRRLDGAADEAGYITVNYVEANINNLRDPLKFLLSI